MSSPYPNIYQIEEIFSNRDTPSVFNAHLADHVDVTVVGKDFHISGNYKSKQAFHEEIFARVAAALKEETIRTEVVRVIGRGDSAWAAVESLATATSKYDTPYHVEFVDLVRFDSQGKIAQMKEFFDSGHIHKHVEHHESQQQAK